MVGEFHRLSDQDFMKDFFYKEEYERDNQPSTYLSLAGAKENYSLTFLYQQRVNKFFTVIERLPEAKLNIRKVKLFNHLNLYYKNISSVARLSKLHAEDIDKFTTPDANYDTMRMDSYNELSYPFRLLGFLSVNPYIGARETFYADDAQGNDNVTRHIFKTGVDLYTKFYKVYDIETDFLNLDIHNVRHVVVPSVKYVYLRKPNLKPSELFQFDAIDEITRANKADLSVRHKLQTKRKDEEGTAKTVDLLTFIVSTNYIFRDAYGRENYLDNFIDYELEITPYRWMRLDAEVELHRRKGEFYTAHADLSVLPREDLRFDLGYLYEKHSNAQLTGQCIFEINKDNWRKHWGFRIYERYEMQRAYFQEQEYTIIKDLHCWMGEFSCRVKNEKDFTFWCIFRLKAFPNIPFFFRTTYHGPRPGTEPGSKI
jgi:hypothetical protein